MKECPKSGTDLGTIMSNFDYEVEEGSELKLKSMDCYGGYAANGFYGIVWYDGEQFCCEVRRHGSHIETVCVDSLKGVMVECCERFGRD